ncbi:Beta-TrCP [Dactylellina cionopaga]|nr:Beta-TrCP [Dactylellina cionopaga]
MLISGSVDTTIIIWNPETGEKLHTLKSHPRGVQALAIDPVESNSDAVVLYSAGSLREIKKWTITAEKVIEEREIVHHETGINSLRFLGEPGEEDLWSASSDMTAKRFERNALGALGKDSTKGIEADTELCHSDYVNDVAIDGTGRWILTASSDEEVRVWDAASGKLYHTFSGHYDVVTAIAVIGTKLVSVSLDATIRIWSLKPTDVKASVEEAQKLEAGGVVEEKKESSATGKSQPNGMLTEEEERELAELMDDDDD